MRLTALAIAVTLAGCATQSGRWEHATADAAQREKDGNECAYQAAAATAGTPASLNLSIAAAQDVEMTMRRMELNRLCVQSKGYYWVPH